MGFDLKLDWGNPECSHVFASNFLIKLAFTTGINHQGQNQDFLYERGHNMNNNISNSQVSGI